MRRSSLPLQAVTKMSSQKRHAVVLGDGDFSFSAAIAKADPHLRVTATSYDSRQEVERKYAASAVANLESLRGLRPLVTVAHGVDATALEQTLPMECADVSDIHFRHPHTGTRSVEANRRLLRGFLASGASFLQLPESSVRCSGEPACHRRLVVTIKVDK